jgi:hypothetical protein
MRQFKTRKKIGFKTWTLNGRNQQNRSNKFSKQISAKFNQQVSNLKTLFNLNLILIGAYKDQIKHGSRSIKILQSKTVN